ncbi:MAG: pyridoxamine 5-phosphate oxidase [Gammaproteobacteria bacterium RIFCSPHIGHO2_12_FULL_42_10]|nr:MAG: pyridoxamine 5-phosphate oxidase [Gammaproteobacteria bacterium RIFCSPHIGHO2_12_FULL_42_10]
METYQLACNTWDQAEITAIQHVIDKQQFTMGKAVSEFEQQFAHKFKRRFAIMVNSGSSANLLAIAALCYKKDNPLKVQDEVIVPSLSWSTTYYPIHQYNLSLVFVDINKQTLNIDTAQLEAALSPKTRAIFAPSILGNPAPLKELQLFCKKYHLYLIEDNCESMGAILDNQYTGTFGICSTFSTFFSHHMCTMEGGVILTDDEELYHLLLCLRSHGWTRHLPEKNHLCHKTNDPFYESFRFILPGYNVRPLEMSGAIGIEQLKKLDTFIKIRRENAAYLQTLFHDDENFYLQQENGQSSWFGFSLLLKETCDIPRIKFIERLNQASIEVRPIVSGNFLKNDVIKYLNHRIVGKHDDTEYVHEHGFFVGNHHFDIKKFLDRLKAVVSL